MTMKSSLLLLFAAALCAGPILSAGTVRFRSGEVLRAELTQKEPNILEFTPAHRSALPANAVWGVLTVTPDAGRKISIHDYSIRYMGITFPAVALAVDDAPFSTAQWEVPAQSGLRCHLLFALDGAVLAEKNSPKELILVSNGTIPSEQSIPFTVKNKKGFTKAKSVPATGFFPGEK